MKRTESHCFNSAEAAGLEIRVAPRAAGLAVAWPGIRLQSEFSPPELRPARPGQAAWRHARRSAKAMSLARRPGRVLIDTFAGPDASLVREVWVADNGRSVACRLTFGNQGRQPVLLDALRPLRCAGPGSLLLNGKDAGAWEAVRQGRQKGYVPTSLRLGHFDGDYAQALSGMTELGDSLAQEGKPRRVECDSFCVLRAANHDNAAILLIGFLSQTGHLAAINIQTDARRRTLEQLVAECDFDGCRVPPGGTRASQWVILMAGENPAALVDDFADRVGCHHNVKKPPANPPAVFCTWQYYGPHFGESDFLEDTAYLEKDRIPFDVFLIDMGWFDAAGDWAANERWPGGMKQAAARIKALGYRPGLWTCPFLVEAGARLAKAKPEWLLRLRGGALLIFPMGGVNYRVLDPTYPGVAGFFERLYRRITADWDFTYHKLDFARAVFMDRRARFHDPACTRLEAYRRGLEAVRRGIGPGGYLSVCGGHYGGSLGLADSQRSGSDVAACWDKPPALPKFKQNILRSWMNRLWHADPDAMMVRRRARPINRSRTGFLSLGKFTDEEARTIAVNQYVGGGLVCLCEKFRELDPDRKALYRHVIPSLGVPATPADYFASPCPSVLATRVAPACRDLEPWVTVAVVNWADAPLQREIELCPRAFGLRRCRRYFVFEFFEQRALGLFEAGRAVPLGILPPHASRVLKIIPWRGRGPVFVSTDLHLSGGGVEIAEWRADKQSAYGRVATPWQYPVTVTAGFDSPATGYELAAAVVPAGRRSFVIRRGGAAS